MPDPPVLFLDANVLFSAAYFSGTRAAVLFGLAGDRRCRLVSSAFACEEARRNLAVKKPEALETFSSLTARITILPEADAERLRRAAEAGLKDDMDIPILAAAMGRADVLVTGDRKHFGHLMNETIQGVMVLGLAETLNRFSAK